jgi:hypothetical protein
MLELTIMKRIASALGILLAVTFLLPAAGNSGPQDAVARLVTSSPEAVECFGNYFQQIWETSSSREAVSFLPTPAATLAVTAWWLRRAGLPTQVSR